MGGDFQVGDIVECIDKTPRHRVTAPYSDKLVLGELYTVTGLCISPTGEPALIVDRAQHHPQTVGWAIWRFRKVYRPRSDAFSDLLKLDAPNKEPVAA